MERNKENKRRMKEIKKTKDEFVNFSMNIRNSRQAAQHLSCIYLYLSSCKLTKRYKTTQCMTHFCVC